MLGLLYVSMAESKHYCADCKTHFTVSPQEHADIEHGGGLFRGLEGGDWKDWRRRQRFRA